MIGYRENQGHDSFRYVNIELQNVLRKFPHISLLIYVLKQPLSQNNIVTNESDIKKRKEVDWMKNRAQNSKKRQIDESSDSEDL